MELNRYVYAAGNPVRWSDPSGQSLQLSYAGGYTPSRDSTPAIAITGRHVANFLGVVAIAAVLVLIADIVPDIAIGEETDVEVGTGNDGAGNANIEDFPDSLENPPPPPDPFWRAIYRWLLRLAPGLEALRRFLDPNPRTDPDDDENETVLVSHYTSNLGADQILASGIILTSVRESHVYVLEGRSSSARALEAGAISVEARIVLDARRTEIELDPEQRDRIRRRQMNIIMEARRFIMPGPIPLEGRNVVRRKNWTESSRI